MPKEKNKSVVIPIKYRSLFEKLDAESSKQLIMMVFEAAETRDMPQETGNFAVDLVSEMICADVIAYANKYDETCRKRAENGKKGGRPPANSDEPKEETDTKEIAKENTKEKTKEEVYRYGTTRSVPMKKSEYAELERDYEKKVVKQIIEKIDEWSYNKNIVVVDGAAMARKWLERDGIQPNPDRKKSWEESTIEERKLLYPDRDAYTGGYID